MTRYEQNQRFSSTLLLMVLSTFLSTHASAATRAPVNGGSPVDAVVQTQKQRSAERFDILSWVRGNRERVDAQNRKYGSATGGSSLRMDVAFQYFRESGTLSRQIDGSSTVTKIGKQTLSTGRLQVFFNDLFTKGNSNQSLNIDLGIEGYGKFLGALEPETPIVQNERSFAEYGGALLIRPMGRSSQDTGFFIKGGYASGSGKGFFSSTLSPTGSLLNGSFSGFYLGAEAKLYLLPFLGLQGEYTSIPETSVTGDFQGKYALSRFRYGVFLDLWVVYVGAYLTTQEEMITSTSTSSKYKHLYPAQGITAALHF